MFDPAGPVGLADWHPLTRCTTRSSRQCSRTESRDARPDPNGADAAETSARRDPLHVVAYRQLAPRTDEPLGAAGAPVPSSTRWRWPRGRTRAAGRPERDRAPSGRPGRGARPGRASGAGVRRLAPGARTRGPRQPQRGGGQALFTDTGRFGAPACHSRSSSHPTAPPSTRWPTTSRPCTGSSQTSP